MAFEVLATTAGVGVLMGVLPRALFALRTGRAEGLRPAAALGLLGLTGVLAVYGASRPDVPTFVANLAGAAACAGYLQVAERCRDIQAERTAMVERIRRVRPVHRARARP